MTPHITESDCEILRHVHPLALERFRERVLGEVEGVVHNSTQDHHARYLEIFKLVQQRDRKISRIFDDPRRSSALTMLAHMRSEGLLTDEEFSSLSQETRNAIEAFLDGR